MRVPCHFGFCGGETGRSICHRNGWKYLKDMELPDLERAGYWSGIGGFFVEICGGEN